MKKGKLIGRFLNIALVSLMIVYVLGGLPGVLNASVQAAPLTYDKNTIRDDYDFYFENSLSEAEIQDIFDSRNSFFKNYTDPETGKPVRAQLLVHTL